LHAATLDDLKSRLLFNNTADIWIAVCREKSWDWKDMHEYDAFIEHLRNSNIPLKPTPMKHAAKGFAASRAGTFIVKLDDTAMEKIRSFNPKKV